MKKNSGQNKASPNSKRNKKNQRVEDIKEPDSLIQDVNDIHQNGSIIEILKKIWNNIQILKIITIVSTVLSLFLGGRSIYDWGKDLALKSKSKRLFSEMEKLNYLPDKYQTHWFNDVESLKGDKNFKDEYYALKVLSACRYEFVYRAQEQSPEFYFERILPDSPYYEKVIHYLAHYIDNQKDTVMRRTKFEYLIKKLDNIQYNNSTYHFVKYLYAQSHSVEHIYKSYVEFTKAFPLSLNDTMYVEVDRVVRFENVVTYSIIDALTYLYNVDLVIKADNDTIKNMVNKYFITLRDGPDDKLFTIKLGLDQKGVVYPFCSNENYRILLNDRVQWLAHTRKTIENLIAGRIKVIE